MAKRELPNLENATPSFLLEEIHKAREMQKEGKFLEGVYRQALDARRDLELKIVVEGKEVGLVDGENFFAHYVPGSQERVDTDKIQTEFTREQLVEKGWIKNIPTTTLRIFPKPPKEV